MNPNLVHSLKTVVNMHPPVSLQVAPLRRSHSLEFQHEHETESRFDAEIDIDIQAAAQLFDLYDVDTFLNDVNTPLAQNQAATFANLTRPTQFVGAAALTETVSTTASEESDESMADLHNTAGGQKPARKSRKEEVIELRGSVKHLADQLEALKAPSNQSSALTKRGGPPLWKFAAMRQLERRRKAEEDNVALREMLELQVQEAKCLQRILKRRTKIQMMENMLRMKRQKVARISAPPSDNATVFKNMFEDTDRCYATVHSYFAERGVIDLPCPGQKREVKRNIVNGTFYENMQRNVLPFSLPKTQKAALMVLNDLGTSGLKRIKDFDKLVEFHAQQSEETINTIASSYFSVVPGHEYVSGAQVQKVTRMYIEDDCAVFIWRMLAVPKLKGSNAPVGYQLVSTLQAVLRRREVPTISGDESTELLVHLSASRHDLNLPTSGNFREPGHLDMGITVWDKLMSSIAPEVESMLIDEACGTLNLDNSRTMERVDSPAQTQPTHDTLTSDSSASAIV